MVKKYIICFFFITLFFNKNIFSYSQKDLDKIKNQSFWSMSTLYMPNADLSNASLSGENLWNANLWNANLWNADLWCVNLQQANLKYADLQYAGLEYSDLCFAKLSLSISKNKKSSFYYNILFSQLFNLNALFVVFSTILTKKLYIYMGI